MLSFSGSNVPRRLDSDAEDESTAILGNVRIYASSDIA
jgi:hypothetical protein